METITLAQAKRIYQIAMSEGGIWGHTSFTEYKVKSFEEVLAEVLAEKTLPELPKPSLSIIILRGDLGTCPECHSTEQRRKIFGMRIGKRMGCIQPECGHYYKNRK